MDIKNRIEYSQEAMFSTLERSLAELNAFRYDARFKSLLGETFIEKLNYWEGEIKKRKDDPFTLVVIGDFKRGKSTLINAILGEEIVTTDVTTETVTLNRISYGAPGNEAVLKNARRVRLSNSELKREALKELMEQLGEPIERIELRRPCEVLKKLTIIDTPGTGDAMEDFSALVKDSILQADAVLYVYNVQYPLSKTEQLFLKAAVLPQKYTTLFLVGNFSDILGTKEQYERMRKMLAGRVSGLLPDADVIMISALDELCRQLGENAPETELTPVLREQFDFLRAELNRVIDEKSESVVLDRMQRLVTAMLNDLTEELDSIESGLKMSVEDAQRALSEMQQKNRDDVEHNTEILNEIRKTVEAMKTEANNWMGEFMERIIDESGKLSEVSADDLKQYYEFYCIDTLGEAMNTCLDYHRERLYDYMETLAEGAGKGLTSSGGKHQKYSFRMSVDNRIWTKGDTVGLAASYAANFGALGTVASIIADGISGSMREKEAEKRAPELVKQIARKLTGLNASVNQSIISIYSDLGEKAEKLYLDYYNEERERTQKLLQQSVRVAGKQKEEKEQLLSVVYDARTILKKCILE